jgi:hypothetical protein
MHSVVHGGVDAESELHHERPWAAASCGWLLGLRISVLVCLLDTLFFLLL